MSAPNHTQTLEDELALHPELSPAGRRVWLAAHMEEYVERLLGFGTLPHTTMDSLVHSLLFTVIVVAAGVMTRELEGASLPAAIHSKWQSFLDLLQRLPQMADKQELNRLKAINEFRAALESVEATE